jgi:hypothetical protein
MRLFDVQWHFKLSQVPNNEFTVSMDWNHEDKNIKIFTSFNNYIEFYYYQQKFSERNFYEVIRGSQKLHFDIDCKDEDEKLLDNIISQLSLAINKLLKDPLILVYKSMNKNNTQTKKSAHIIVDRYFHNDHHEAKTFYHMVLDNIDESLRVYVDPCVYSSVQQFRLLGSSKINSDRVKILVNRQDGDDLDNFRMSLVTYTKRCSHIPLSVKTRKVKKSTAISNKDIDVDRVYQIVKSHVKNFNFDIHNVYNGIINLKNKGKYLCSICNRVHEHENPYIMLSNNKIYYVCRRAQTEGKEYYRLELNINTCHVDDADTTDTTRRFIDVKDPLYNILLDI